MRKHPMAFAALVLSVTPFLAGCSQSEYEACEDRATEEWTDYREGLIDSGEGDDSLKDMYLQMEGYIIDQCGLESDYE